MRIALLIVVAACSPMVYVDGVPNLAKVDDGVYRSGEPTGSGWAAIAKLAAGRRVHVVKLNFDSEGTDDGARALGFDVVYLPMQPAGDQDVWDDVKSEFEGPDPASVDRAVAQLAWCRAHPLTDVCLVHCTHGQDRTGDVVGTYRHKVDGWPKERAWREMLDHHFHWELVGLTAAWERTP